jgi:hypothetical protein
MHPMIMKALTEEIGNDRRNEQEKLQLRSQALAGGSTAVRAQTGRARRVVAVISLRARLS